ncbi:holo-ACP synthase [Streptomyces sp. NPDC000151]|uniref:holo-ACP synthase n=1 Tax=Streptomyces sp. NPDC000151 TaxID=3154244 RepID=UPI00331B9AC1
MSRTAHHAARIGLDVLEHGELSRLLTRPWFLRFSYAPEETARAEAMGAERRLEFLAGRFAAKEAILKVLGTGMLQGVAPREIYVDRDDDGAPVVRLRGRAAKLATSEIALSITHKQNVVAAVAISMPSAMDADPVTTADHVTTAGPVTTPALSTDRKELVIMSPADNGEEPEITAFLRVRIGQEEAHYGGGLVDGARILRLFGDLVTEITVRTDGDEGLLSEYSGIRFTAPVAPGDYVEASGRLVRRTRLRRVVELQAYKVIAARPDSGPSAADVLDEPQLLCTATATTVVPPPKKNGKKTAKDAKTAKIPAESAALPAKAAALKES